MVAVYPITPQSSLVEYLAKFIADGRLDADIVDVEGEHSVLSVLQGAALAGARTYTATCGPGLAFMFEPYFRTPGMRLPIVMSIVTRDTLTPQSVWGGHQDAMTVREVGWIQMYCETVQEVLDTTIMAYKIAEHHDVMLPVNVCHDGNYLSFGTARVELPDQDEVDAFLGAADVNWHVALDPQRPMAVDPLTGGAGGPGPSTFVRYRKGQCARHAELAARSSRKCMRNGRSASAAATRRWSRTTAWTAPSTRIMTIGSMTGAAKDAVDEARDARRAGRPGQGQDLPPLPGRRRCATALAKVKAVGVVDRSVCFGWNCGPLFQDTIGALYYASKRIPAMSFIGGLAGADITVGHFDRVIERTAELARDGPAPTEPVWLNEKD